MTLKFEHYPQDIFLPGDDEQPKVVEIIEAPKDVWHRPFQFKTLKAYDDWVESINVDLSDNQWLYNMGSDPRCYLQNPVEDDSFMQIEYLTFYDASFNCHRYILKDIKCFIMNDNGQTIDTFVA